MRESNFELVRERTDIMQLARDLLKPSKNPTMFYYPGERSQSIKIYPNSQSFYDFGRGTGGDCIRLWSHVNGCDDWTAAQEIAACFGVDLDADDKITADEIKTHQQARLDAQKAKEQAAERWRREVDLLKSKEVSYQRLLDGGHVKPISDPWCWLVNDLQIIKYRLDALCGIGE